MANKSLLTGGAIMVALVAIIGLSMTTYAADENRSGEANRSDRPFMKEGFSPEKWQERKGEIQEKRASVMAAVEAQNYQAWLEAVGSDSHMAQEISEDEFSRLLEAHQLMQQGQEKMEQARQIKEELGLKPFGNGERSGFGHGMMKKFRPKID